MFPACKGHGLICKDLRYPTQSSNSALMENMSWPGLCSLLGECRLDALGVLKMSHEHWTYLDSAP